jgi:hypothetical protein
LNVGRRVDLTNLGLTSQSQSDGSQLVGEYITKSSRGDGQTKGSVILWLPHVNVPPETAFESGAWKTTNVQVGRFYEISRAPLVD